MSRKLEIGPGKHPVGKQEDGWITVGLSAQWGERPLPFPASYFDEVYASHVLEHIPWTKTVIALRDAYQVLKPGGTIEIWVPNFAHIIASYQQQTCGDDWRRENPTGDFMTWVNGRIFTYGPDDGNWHRACFDPPFLQQKLTEAGFSEVEILPKRTRGVAHGPIDLGAKARRGS